MLVTEKRNEYRMHLYIKIAITNKDRTAVAITSMRKSFFFFRRMLTTAVILSIIQLHSRDLHTISYF